MRFLSEFLGIPYEDILLEPTFNGIPIQPANSQKTDNSDGKLQSFTESKKLDKNQRVLIEKMTVADYQQHCACRGLLSLLSNRFSRFGFVHFSC